MPYARLENISVRVDFRLAFISRTRTSPFHSGTGHNFRFMMYKTGTARMLRQGMGGKICRARKVGGV